ncbi:50S ribosomal protein L1 [Candidatus Berkelbacteria bacterium]|nr:50S ribosomal protein L1 [Candidatus Berkelbacteria bacterium]
MAKKRSTVPDEIGVPRQESNLDEEQVKADVVAAEMDSDPVEPAEEAALHTDTLVARAASGSTKRAVPGVTPTVSTARHSQPKQRSARYLMARSAVDRTKTYRLEPALELVKQTSYARFDGSVEVHIRLLARKGSADTVRGLIHLPHGSGKTANAVVLTDELIETIKQTGKCAYDILIATPALMPKVATIAKILGPQGKMPSPKAGTVSEKPEEILAALASGRVEYRADSGGTIHLTVGKVSWSLEHLRDNVLAVLGALGTAGLRTLTLSATMGPGVRVDLAHLDR